MGAQDGHLNFHTAPELWNTRLLSVGGSVAFLFIFLFIFIYAVIDEEVLLYVHRNPRLIIPDVNQARDTAAPGVLVTANQLCNTLRHPLSWMKLGCVASTFHWAHSTPIRDRSRSRAEKSHMTQWDSNSS